MKVTLLIPTLNEIEAMKIIMPQIKPEWYDELIIVDGGSTDGTIEYAEENGYFVYKQQNKGLNNAYIESIEIITGDIIVVFSPDGNSLPECIPELADKMKQGYDMVIASRYCGGAKSYDDDIITAFGNRMFTAFVNLFFRAKYTDCLVIFRAFRKDLWYRLELGANGPVIEIQMCIRCAKKKLKVADIPGDEPKRIGGERQMSPLYNGTYLLWMIIKELFMWR